MRTLYMEAPKFAYLTIAMFCFKAAYKCHDICNEMSITSGSYSTKGTPTRSQCTITFRTSLELIGGNPNSSRTQQHRLRQGSPSHSEDLLTTEEGGWGLLRRGRARMRRWVYSRKKRPTFFVYSIYSLRTCDGPQEMERN